MVGCVISHYRIHSKLGAGGMVVYKAEDTKLERTVALKFLAPHLVSDEALRKRFEQEAKAVAALDHPNICTVFEIDEAEGSLFLAMALVEGPTVKERIAQRPLKLEEALDIAIQTAEGLRAAHQKGIVHRDIKPANVMVNAQQQVKIMDFGLARLIDATVTQAGSVAGTPAYMSPEQVQGQPTEGRSDIWSLGVMLYEMIAGRLPFPGQNAQAILHAIQQTEPEPVTGLRGGLPMELDWIIGKCLAKNPAERYQHVDDLIVDLSTLRKRLDSGTVVPTGSATRSRYTAAPTGTAPRPSTIRNAALIAAGGLATVAVAFFGVRALRHAPEASPLRTVRFAFTPTQLVRGGNGEVDAEVSISGDGKHIAYVESQGGQLWVRDIDEEQAHPVPGATAVYQAFWSPDTQDIGYTTGPNCRPGGPSMPGCNIVRIRGDAQRRHEHADPQISAGTGRHSHGYLHQRHRLPRSGLENRPILQWRQTCRRESGGVAEAAPPGAGSLDPDVRRAVVEHFPSAGGGATPAGPLYVARKTPVCGSGGEFS
jgi:hypothetical protein